ncbi:two-component system response regulator BaeR [Comamonas odontotermitis]|uniref:Two-component system response regulator BaeR n=1 Tax=Comamonas odontotermitis TaxID=379895 RepID=A0ABR6RCV6_9BURK|nr:response regulator [Comamonas odontotermitis]MBB6576993.1 two-component system response regulator BaeR [Comamonas odontotermitis]
MNTAKPRILYAEDEADIASVVTDYLHHAGYEVEHFADGSQALAAAIARPPALAILDLMLPGTDGLTILRECRARQLCPVICLTAKVEEVDRLIGLEMGADDYICKPFSPRELVARVKVVLRRNQVGEATASSAAASEWRLDDATCQASWRGQDLGLTRREYTLLSILHRHPGKIYPRSQLLDLAYADALEVSDRAIDSHIKNLRKKLRAVLGDEAECIRSVYGVGFAFEA